MSETTDVPAVTLRDHVDAKLILDEFIAEHEGELTPEIEALLLDHETVTKEKVESIAWFVKQEKARITGVKEMQAQLAKRLRGIEGRVEWLTKTYLLEQMHRLNFKVGDSLKGTLSTIGLQLNNPRLDGEGPTEDTLVNWAIDPAREQFVRYTPESYALDRNALLVAGKLDPTVLPKGMTIVRDESARVR